MMACFVFYNTQMCLKTKDVTATYLRLEPLSYRKSEPII